jgi:putative addiction module component (TIGR02574 family)
MGALTLQEIQRLSVAERIQLVEDIWDSIVTSSESPEIPETQRRELDNRLESHSQEPTGASWADVKSRLLR